MARLTRATVRPLARVSFLASSKPAVSRLPLLSPPRGELLITRPVHRLIPVDHVNFPCSRYSNPLSPLSLSLSLFSFLAFLSSTLSFRRFTPPCCCSSTARQKALNKRSCGRFSSSIDESPLDAGRFIGQSFRSAGRVHRQFRVFRLWEEGGWGNGKSALGRAFGVVLRGTMHGDAGVRSFRTRAPVPPVTRYFVDKTVGLIDILPTVPDCTIACAAFLSFSLSLSIPLCRCSIGHRIVPTQLTTP